MANRQSPFLLEPLESRLLLATDLTSAISSTALIEPITPNDPGSVVVQLTNQGSTATKGQVEVSIYASQDQVFDSYDVLLGTSHTTGKLNAGQSQAVTVNVLFPSALTPGSYSLLSVADPANRQVESNETNNAGTGPAINFRWMFGNIPGHTSNEPLTIKDADGTAVTFSLSGPGYGEVTRDNGLWDLRVTGTNSSSIVTVSTAGGNGRVTFDDIHVMGPLGAFTAATADLRGTMAIDGPMTALTIGSVNGGTIAVQSVQTFTVGVPLIAPGNLTNASILVGANLGQDGKLGGTGLDTDTYGSGQIGLWFVVNGSVTNSFIRVGQDPVDGIFSNGNDVIQGGSSSRIASIVISGDVSAESRFVAGAFPTTALIKGVRVQTATDPRFITDVQGPTMTAVLAQDTGTLASDGLTNDPTITGSVTDPKGIATFVASFGGTPTFNILSDLQPNGTFTLTMARLAQIYGAPLADGTYTLTLRATDTVGNPRQTTVAFTLDSSVSTLTLDLDPASDTAPVGDQQTTSAIVTLAGQTEALASVLLLETNETTTADAVGNFSFGSVSLALGANTLTIQATDSAGNQRTVMRTITRLSASGDSDGDGTPDSEEGAGPNGGDANNDGIPDSQQANVVSVLNSGGQYITLVAPAVASFTGVHALDNPSPGDTPAEITFPLGLVDFQLTGLTDGTAIVELLLPAGVSPNTYWKYEATPDNPTPHWYEFLYDGTTGAEINGNVVTLHFQDGARGDSDLTVNGTIADWGGPGYSIAPVLEPIAQRTLATSWNLTTDFRPGFNPGPDSSGAPGVWYYLQGGPSLATIPGSLFRLPYFFTSAYTIPMLSEWFAAPGGFPVLFSNPSVGQNLTGRDQLINPSAPDFIWPANAVLVQPSGSQLAVVGWGSPITGVVNIEGSFADVDVTGGGNGMAWYILGYSHIYGVRQLAGGSITEGGAQGFSMTNVSILRDEYIFFVVDPIGGDARSDVARLDLRINAVTAVGVFNAPVNGEGETITFTAKAIDWDTPAPFLRYSLSPVPGGPPVPANAFIDPRTGHFTWTPTEDQGPGFYLFDVVVSDGFSTDRETIAIRVDEVNQPPMLPPIGNRNVDEGQGLTIALSASDPDVPAQSLTYTAVGLPANATFNPVTRQFSFTPDETQGGSSYDVTFSVTDGVATTSEAITITVNEVNVAPVLAPIGNRTVDEATELRFTISGSDVDLPAQTLVYSATGLPDGASFNPATREFVWTPTEAQGPGTYGVTFTLTDGVATTSETITITVNEVNVAPVLAPIGNRNVDEGQGLTIALSASDPDVPAQSLTYTAVGLPANATFNPVTRQFSFTPDETQGGSFFDVFFSVSDGGPPVGETVRITVNEVNVAPVLAPIGNRTVDEETELRFTISGSDVDLPAQTLVYSATGLPDGASFNPATREFVWTPTEAQGPGTYGVTFTLTDGVATTTETLAITVNEVNVAPVLAPIGNRTIDELQLLSFIATATDNDVPANSLTFSLENGVAGLVPTGASINPTTGEFTWTPTEAQGPGSYTFDVVVTDNGSPILSDRETITVTVHEVNVAPVLAPIGNQTIDERVLFTFTASATDADLPANSLSFSLENGLAGLVPTGASINPTTGEFTWTPTEAQGPASYTFDVVVTDNGSPILSDRETITITVNETITNTFQGLGDLPGGWLYDSHAVGDFFNETPGMGISADGSRIAVNANLFPNEHQDPLNPGPLTGGNTPIIWDATAGLLSPFVIPVGYRYPTITAISADGSTVVGTIGLVNGGAVAFVARQGTDLVLLGDLPDGSPGGPNAGATAVSADGSVVVGYRYLPSSGQEAFRWTASGGMQSLDSFDVATAVSADGMVIVGYRGTVGDREALRWTASTGTQGLGDLPGGSFYSMPTGLSADGSVIVGDSESALDGVNTSLAFRWTVSDGMQGLGDLPGGIVFSSATAVSADGNVIVGRSNSGVQEAFRWTAAGGMQGLGYSTDTSIWFSQATGVSADGNVVVGLENGGAFRWTASEGLQRISTPDFGVASVVGVSADGNVIAGRGNSLLHPEYPREAWRWSTTGGFVTISSQPNVGNYSQVGYVSSDGTVVAGTSSSAAGTEAFRWTEADGMQSLGDLPGGHWYTLSVATGISGDGSTIIGYSESDDGMQAFRWTAADGMQGLGDLPGYTFFSMATGVSADGSVVVGYSMSDSGEEAFRWTATDGMQGLGALPGGLQSRAVAVSADGSVIIGYGSSTSGTQAFRWTASGGMEGLGDLPGGQFFSQPTAVSANGSVIVGYSYSTVVYPEAFRWTASGGMQGLGDLPEGDFHSRATGVSADGTVVMGYGFSASGQEAFRWTVSDGMQGLGDLPGGAYYSNPTSMSADGSVIVGASVSASGYEAFYWSTSTGMVRLEDLLGVNYGLAPQFSGWTLQPTFLTISSDGKTLLGNGYNPDRWREAWMAFLDGAII